jgi:hypothetical protein
MAALTEGASEQRHLCSLHDTMSLPGGLRVLESGRF